MYAAYKQKEGPLPHGTGGLGPEVFA